MRKNYLSTNIRPLDNEIVRCKQMGNIVELMYSNKVNVSNHIQKVDKDTYIDLKTGELKEFVHNENRASDYNSVRQSLSKLRDLINANVTDVTFCRWITLTYAENMTDTEILYIDFKNFIKRMRYAGYKFEYIVAMEPQSRGAWHAHLLMIFSDVAPFIANSDLAAFWGHGFVKIKKLDSIDNVGAYLTAYLGDLEMEDIDKNDIDLFSSSDFKVVEVFDDDSMQTKRFIKGGRLHMYPSGFNLFRSSRGVKRPTMQYMTSDKSDKLIDGLDVTYESTVVLSDKETDFHRIINYRYFNKLRTDKNV